MFFFTKRRKKALAEIDIMDKEICAIDSEIDNILSKAGYLNNKIAGNGNADDEKYKESSVKPEND